MPSQYDTTYNNRFRKPVFDDESDKKMWQSSREADEVLVEKLPPVPTPEMEVEYIDWLKEDMKSDPWVTFRFRKYMASPKRIPWKNQRQLKHQHQWTFIINWMIGSALFWPVATMIGRYNKTSRAGVPAVHLNRFVHDFPKLDPGRTARHYFRWYAVGSSVLAGMIFSLSVTNSDFRCSNAWYNRPDLKPYPAMVKSEQADQTEETMLSSQYMTRDNKFTDGKRSPLYRFFMGRDADYTIKANPYRTSHPEDIWDARKGHFATYSNSFGEHHQ